MIKVTFDADDESELREDWCPAVRSFDDPPRAPQDGHLARIDGLTFCGRDVRPIRVLRGCTVAFVWRITGGLGEVEPLTGEWAWCQIETETEQIARLEGELAAERARAAEVAAALSRLGAVVPHLQIAARMAQAEVPGSKVQLAIVAKAADGSGLVTAFFEAAEFLADLAVVTGEGR